MAFCQLNLMKTAGVSFALAALLGCEARLDMSGVNTELENPIHRYDNFQAAERVDDQFVFVGDAGAVVTGQGETVSSVGWKRVELEGSPSLIDVASCSDGTLVALSFENDIWVKKEAISDWVRRSIEGADVPQALTCDANSKIWVVGEFSSIKSSENFGADWDYFSFDEDLIFTSVQVLKSGKIFVLGEFGAVATSVDGGESFQLLPPIPNEFYPQDAYFVNDLSGWVVGLRGQVLQTDDGGLTWASLQTDTDVSLFNIVNNQNSVVAVGERGLVLKHVENGNWVSIPQELEVFTHIRAATAFDKCNLLVAGGGGRIYGANICGEQP